MAKDVELNPVAEPTVITIPPVAAPQVGSLFSFKGFPFTFKCPLFTTKVSALTYLRLSIITLALLMCVLDCVHISQLKHSWAAFRSVPWPFSEMLGTSATDGPPPAESDLHGYYCQLLIPDLMAILMMLWLLFGRQCTDKQYHVGLRILFSALLLTLVLWYPCEEIVRIQSFSQRLSGSSSNSVGSGDNRALGPSMVPSTLMPGYKTMMFLATETGAMSVCVNGSSSSGSSGFGDGYQWTPPSAGSVYFCFLNHLKVAPVSPFVQCGVYRTRNVFALVVALMIVGELGLTAVVGGFERKSSSSKIAQQLTRP
ncbi:hypothetical protein EDD21DRAFT_420593 [Dissophora ornata]|nr:hypothetical protein EDD21DRAFT_420593 [Dissophora ornata]